MRREFLKGLGAFAGAALSGCAHLAGMHYSEEQKYLTLKDSVDILSCFSVKHEPLVFVDGEKKVGYVDGKNKLVRISDIYGPSEAVDTTIHEMLHIKYPGLSENEIRYRTKIVRRAAEAEKGGNSMKLMDILRFLSENDLEHSPYVRENGLFCREHKLVLISSRMRIEGRRHVVIHEMLHYMYPEMGDGAVVEAAQKIYWNMFETGF